MGLEMSIVINDELKDKFIDFCNKNYPTKIRKDNRFNESKWFYIQVGNCFSDWIHCEFFRGNIELHLEFETKEDNKIFSKILEEFIPILKNKNKKNAYILVPKSNIKDENDLLKKMGEEINKIEESLEKVELFIKKYVVKD